MELKYIETCEFGKKGALHHHMVVNSCAGTTTADIRKKWPHGRVHFNPLDDSGEYSKLAAYLLKNRMYWRKCGGTGKQYSPSRNLIRPVTKKVVVQAERYYEKPRERKGYYVAADSERHFMTEAGWPYMRYIIVKGERAP